jgi:hypothetical protein
MMNPIVVKRIASESELAAEGLLRRTFGRFRLPLRKTSSLEQTATRNRVERLFEVNFRSPWTR